MLFRSGEYEVVATVDGVRSSNGLWTIDNATDPKYFLIRSSSIKEMVVFGADISKMVPKTVLQAVNAKVNTSKVLT